MTADAAKALRLCLLALLRLAHACLTGGRTFEEVSTIPNANTKTVPEYKITKSELLQPSCELGSWSPWSVCSATCGTGTEMSVRSVELKSGSLLTEDCQREPLLRTRICAFKACELTEECSFGDWLEWSPCSRECGLGSQTRVRATFEASGPCTQVTRQSQLCFRRLCAFRGRRGARVKYECSESMNVWNTAATLAHVPGEPSECCRICGASQVCAGWSWQVDTCFLKQANGTNRDWPNALSGSLAL